IKLTQQLIDQHKPAALIGFAGTLNVGELLKRGVLEKAGIALVGPYSGGEPLRNPFNPWVFHVRAGYVDETAKMVDHLATLGIKRIAVFHQDDAFGKSGLAGVETAAVKFGSEIIAKGTYDRLNPDVTNAVKTISAAKPQAVIMVSVNKPTAAFVKAYREANGEG
ncbi:MAG TPA: ABC transporter substrate-binding protein, partial [Rhodocyclaceae bacterium]|nr:ABC transporter substrate-binding protein [Rhodocyclaceae bacterium]